MRFYMKKKKYVKLGDTIDTCEANSTDKPGELVHKLTTESEEKPSVMNSQGELSEPAPESQHNEGNLLVIKGSSRRNAIVYPCGRGPEVQLLKDYCMEQNMKDAGLF